MDLTMFINAALGAAGGGGVVGALVLAMYQHNLKQEREQREREREERAILAKKVEDLEKTQIVNLAARLERHLDEDNPTAVDNRLKSLEGEVKRLGDTLDRDRENIQRELRGVSSALGEFKGAVTGINKWLDNINHAVQTHITGSNPHGK